jgi:predicted dehydrogenase
VRPRAAVIEDALNAGKHVLSQKPFVLDLEVGKKLADLADSKGLKLAVNQNGRWAPYVRWVHAAIQAGLIGDVQSVNIQINWDHTWVKGSEFEKMEDLILYDFAVHWLDMTRLYFGDQRALAAQAFTAHAPGQEIKVPMMGNAAVRFESGLASLIFDGHSMHMGGEYQQISGTKGTIKARGGVCSANEIVIENADGKATFQAGGNWFVEGFRGTMGELLCAIEEDREPANSARNNLKSLEVVFGVLKSAEIGEVVKL